MAKRKSFMLYMDYEELFDELSDKQLKRLISLLFDFAKTNIRRDDISDIGVRMAYRVIVAQMERDFEKYIKVCERNAKNSKNAGRPKKSKESSGYSGNPEKSREIQMNPKKSKKSDEDKDKDIDILSLSDDKDNIEQAGTAPVGAAPPAPDENIIPWDEIDFELV